MVSVRRLRIEVLIVFRDGVFDFVLLLVTFFLGWGFALFYDVLEILVNDGLC